MSIQSKGLKLKDKALSYFQSGNWVKSLSVGRQALRFRPGDTELIRTLALCHFRLGRHAQARRLLQHGLGKHPESIPLLLNLASVEKKAGQPDRAIAILTKALNIKPNDPAVYFNLGNAYVAEALYQQARQAFCKAVDLKPAYWQAWLNLGHVNKSLGEIEEAAHCYRQVLALRPDNSRAYLGLANLRRNFLKPQDIPLLQRLMESSSDSTSRIEAGFALGEYHHIHGKRMAAASCWKQANQQKLNQLLTAGQGWSKPVGPDDLVLAEGDMRGKVSQARACGMNPESNRAIFVTGVPRSGTTLVEQILASHSVVTGASELPFVPQLLGSLARSKKLPNVHELFAHASLEEWQALGQSYLQKTVRWQETHFFVDKLPENLEYLGEILMMLPEARVIVCERVPQALALSNFRQLYAAGRAWSYSIETIYEYIESQQEWLAFWLKIFPDRIYKLDYETLVGKLQQSVHDLNQFIGLPFEKRQMFPHRSKREIRTASAGQVTESVHTKSIRLWEAYKEMLSL